MRLRVPLALVLVAALAGCGAKVERPMGQQPVSPELRAKRISFLKDYGGFSDQQLARLCPALYPKDFLANPKKYGLKKGDKTRGFSAKDRQRAATAGCGAPR